MERPSIIEFKGQKYRLSGRYYRRHVWGSPGPSNLHRAIWEHHNGPIPEKHHIHHINGDPFDNRIENLECISAFKHNSEHAKRPDSWSNSARNKKHLRSIRPKAAEWHRSPEGRKWHKRHAKRTLLALPEHTKRCDFCGDEYRTTRKKKARFCSNRCASAQRRRSGLDNEQRSCAACGTGFTVNRYEKTRTCSRKCVDALRAAARLRPDG